jgi:hypothetical protein
MTMEKVLVNRVDITDLRPLSKACTLQLGSECFYVEQMNVSQC